MLIIPPLLAEQPANAPAIAPAQTQKPDVVLQSAVAVPASLPSIAPPETTSADGASTSSTPIFSSSGTQLPALDSSLEQTTAAPDQQSENWRQCKSENLLLSERVVLGNLAELDRGNPQAISKTNQQPSSVQSDNSRQSQPASSLHGSPQTENELWTLEQQIIEQKLAEIVAQDRPEKEAQLQENLIAAAINYANQGQFDQARRVIQDPVIPAAIQLNVLNKINSLEAETTRIAAVKAAEATRLANEQRKQQSSFQYRPLYGAPQTALNPINVGPISLSDRGLGLAYRTTPVGREYDRSISLKGLPGNGNLSLLFPLPAPAPLTSGYGWRVHPVRGDQRFHSGVDIGAPEGTPVLASYSGTVATADTLGGYGLAVVLQHNDGAQDTLYAHLSEILVRPGEKVEQGSVIGRVGSTGLSTGPHLHFELRQKTADGKMETVDPGPQIEVAMNQLVKSLQTAQRKVQKGG